MGKIVAYIRGLKHNAFVKHNAIFFVGSIGVGALNYLYYPILGRLLTPEAFGEVQTLVSFFLQLGIFLTVLGLVTVNITTNYRDPARRNDVIFELERVALLVSCVLLVVTVLFRHQLQIFFRFNDSFPFVILMMAIVASVPFTFRSSFIRGKHAFGVSSIGNVVASAAKILFSAFLVAIGFGTVGAMLGVVGAQILALVYVWYWARRFGLTRDLQTPWRLPNIKLILPELRYSIVVLITSLIITLQFSIDILVVKHYFDAKTAGLYAGIATVARIIFFLTGSISQVLMPSVKLKASSSENRKLLVKSTLMLSGVSLPALAVFILIPAYVIQLLMGHQYTTYAYLLPLLSVAIFAVSIVNLVVSYYMALRRYSVVASSIAGATVTYGLMVMNHTSLVAIVANLLVGSISMLLFLTVPMFSKRIRKRRRED